MDSYFGICVRTFFPSSRLIIEEQKMSWRKPMQTLSVKLPTLILGMNLSHLFIEIFIFCECCSQYRLISCRYEAFDFHAECSKMRWDRLSILLDRLSHEQDELSLFLLTRDGTLVSQQDGVFRTNCIDCLDRTNVVQSMLAKRSLSNALQVCDNMQCCAIMKALRTLV